MTLRNLTPANLARAAVEGVLWSLAYGVQVLRGQAGAINPVILTGGASQSDAVQDRDGGVRSADRGDRHLRKRRGRCGPAGGLGADRVAARMERSGYSTTRTPPRPNRTAAEISERYHGIVSAHYTRL